MTERVTPNNLSEMLLACQQQHEHMNAAAFGYGADWEGDCQAFVHCMWGVGGGFGSAFAQWLGLDAEDRLTLTELKGDLANAPLGASLFSKGSSPFGHTWIRARPFPSHTPGSWTTDLWKTGLVGKVPINAPHTEWGHALLGAGLSTNGYALDLTGKNPPKPKQNKRYQRLNKAIHNMGEGIDSLVLVRSNLRDALETAKSKHDTADVNHFSREIIVMNGSIQESRKELKRLQTLYSNARHA